MSLISSYTKEELEDIVSHNYSISEVMQALGYSQNGGTSRAVVMNYLRDNKIDTTHFVRPTPRSKWTPNEAFVKNSAAKQNIVRRLYHQGQYT